MILAHAVLNTVNDHVSKSLQNNARQLIYFNSIWTINQSFIKQGRDTAGEEFQIMFSRSGDKATHVTNENIKLTA